jgi:hypothetical protein
MQSESCRIAFVVAGQYNLARSVPTPPANLDDLSLIKPATGGILVFSGLKVMKTGEIR